MYQSWSVLSRSFHTVLTSSYVICVRLSFITGTMLRPVSVSGLGFMFFITIIFGFGSEWIA